MIKSILVIDTPEDCSKCLLKSQLYDVHYICCGNHRRMVIPSNKNKPDWCPLKEVPQHKDYNGAVEESIKKHKFDAEDSQEYVYLAGKVSGWNMCINEILKGRD